MVTTVQTFAISLSLFFSGSVPASCIEHVESPANFAQGTLIKGRTSDDVFGINERTISRLYNVEGDNILRLACQENIYHADVPTGGKTHRRSCDIARGYKPTGILC